MTSDRRIQFVSVRRVRVQRREVLHLPNEFGMLSVREEPAYVAGEANSGRIVDYGSAEMTDDVH